MLSVGVVQPAKATFGLVGFARVKSGVSMVYSVGFAGVPSVPPFRL